MYTPDKSLDQPNDPNPEYFTYEIKVSESVLKHQIDRLQRILKVVTEPYKRIHFVILLQKALNQLPTPTVDRKIKESEEWFKINGKF